MMVDVSTKQQDCSDDKKYCKFLFLQCFVKVFSYQNNLKEFHLINNKGMCKTWKIFNQQNYNIFIKLKILNDKLIKITD